MLHPRMSVKEYTCGQPCSFNNFAACRKVCPVVYISSTKITVLLILAFKVKGFSIPNLSSLLFLDCFSFVKRDNKCCSSLLSSARNDTNCEAWLKPLSYSLSELNGMGKTILFSVIFLNTSTNKRRNSLLKTSPNTYSPRYFQWAISSFIHSLYSYKEIFLVNGSWSL